MTTATKQAPRETAGAASAWQARSLAAAPWTLLFVASFLFRLPSLVNAAGTNSDAAVVGLQGMHILRGEWSWFLWGSGYQTSVDSLVAAAAFFFTGPSPLVLMLTTLVGHVVLTWLAYDLLRRHLPAWTAAILTTPLVFTSGPIHTYVLYPPRQASLTITLLAFWLIDGARASRRPLPRYASGAAVASLACFADPYGLLFLPPLGIFAVLCSFDGLTLSSVRAGPDRALFLRRIGASLAGGLAGMVPYWLLRQSSLASHGQTSLKMELLPRNWKLLWDDCLPWLLGTKVYAAKQMSDYEPWETGSLVHAFQVVAAVSTVALLLSGGALFFARKIPWELRRLGLLGAVMVPATMGGFLLSPMVMDHFSSRYLVAMLLTAPFALAPAAWLMRARHLALALAPHLVSAAVSGWVSFRPFGLTLHPSIAADERLGVALRERGIHYAVADYWASYRLTLLYRENPIVVPKHEAEDRYRPYRDAFEAAPVVAYVFDPYRSHENLAEHEALIRADKTRFEPVYERFEVDRFLVMILRRKPEVRFAAR